jgi:hypothetical protein
MKIENDQITRRVQSSGHIVVMIEVRGRIYAATYAPDSDTSDEIIRDDLRRYGLGKRRPKGFKPYDQSRGVYIE